MYVYVYAYVHVYVNVYVYVYVYVCMCMYVHVCVCMYVSLYVVYAYVYVYVCECVCACVCVCVCVHACVYWVFFLNCTPIKFQKKFECQEAYLCENLKNLNVTHSQVVNKIVTYHYADTSVCSFWCVDSIIFLFFCEK